MSSDNEFSQKPNPFIRKCCLCFSETLDAIYSERNMTKEAQAAISLLQMSQEDQQKSATSHDRKDRILSQLFENRDETLTRSNLFRGF